MINIEIQERGIDPKNPREYKTIPAVNYLVYSKLDDGKIVFAIPNACGGETRIIISSAEKEKQEARSTQILQFAL